MKEKMFATLMLLAVIFLCDAQTLGEFKPDDKSWGLKKLDGANKIYIAAFTVNYQIYNEKQDFKQGGRTLGGGMKGDAFAEASIGIDGLGNSDVQKITDKLYADYIGMLKAKGLTIVTADEAAKTEVYNDFTRMKGEGTVSLAQIPGTMTSVPNGYEFFVKSVNKKGKTKSGGFLNNSSFLYPKLSKELNDAIIAEVNMYIMFVEDKNAFKGNGANIKIKTNLRLAANEAVVMTDDRKAVVKFKGQNTITAIASAVNFYHGKMGMGSTSNYTGTLRKPLEIEGVIEDTKVQSFANRSMATASYQTLYGTYYSIADKSSKAAKVVNVDPAKYEDGVYEATKKFVEYHTKQFLDSF